MRCSTPHTSSDGDRMGRVVACVNARRAWRACRDQRHGMQYGLARSTFVRPVDKASIQMTEVVSDQVQGVWVRRARSAPDRQGAHVGA